MKSNRSVPSATVIPVFIYPDVRAAVEWLETAFGFAERVRIGESHRAQLSFGDGAVIVGHVRGERRPPRPGEVTHTVMVRVDDVRAHCERARANGGRILMEPTDFEYGERQYSVEDPAGHQWTFSETLADVAPEDWGETAVGIDSDRLADALRVLAEVEQLPTEHPDAVAVRRAVGKLFKTVKEQRRAERRSAIRARDEAITAATATGAPGRSDDETQGLALTSSATGSRAGTLGRARACYICKQRYRDVDAFYHQLCPPCAALNHERRDARTDLTGRRALLTGGRAKIGMYIALRLLRDGAHTTITTRFPRDAVRRFTAMEDSAEWIDRLRIVGVDLRDPGQVVALAGEVAARGPLDILINNAAQTVRRSPAAYAHLATAAEAPLPSGPLPEVVTLERAAFAATDGPSNGHWSPTPQALTALAITAGSASPERIAAGTAIDAGGLAPDLHPYNSWSQVVDEVDAVELLEVQLCNQTAPFILISRLRAALAASAARRTYVVNVSAMEGQFSRGYKGPGHPHTNMAKAALNMLTRTSAAELLSSGILMTSVDTGWITDERPHPTKTRLAEEGFHAPLDLVDGAARVYDPIVRGEAGEDVLGVFLKDYAPAPW